MSRIGEFLPLTLVLVSVVAIFMFGLIPSSHASSDFDDHKAMEDMRSSENIEGLEARYNINVNEKDKKVIINASFENLKTDEVRMSFYKWGLIYKKSDLKYSIIESDSPILAKDNYGWRMNVGNDNNISVKYKISNIGNTNFRRPFSTFSDTFMTINGVYLFAAPIKPDGDRFIDKIKPFVTFEIPDEWTPITTYQETGENTFRAENIHELRRAPILLSEIRYRKDGYHYGLKTTFFAPVMPENFKKESFWLPPNYTLYHNYDLNIAKDAELFMKRYAYATNYFSEKWEVAPPNRVIVAPFDTWIPRWGAEQYDWPSRESVEHHIGQFFIGRTVGTPFDSVGYFTQYFDSIVASKFTEKERFLGKIYAQYLSYERGYRKRMKDTEGEAEFVKAYGYTPMIIFYLNNKIKEETNGEKSLHDVLKNIFDKYKYSGVSKNEFTELTKSVTGVDFTKFMKEHVFGDYEIPIKEYMNKYKEEFENQLNFFRRNNEAPAIIYYAYIEIQANKGNPETIFYQPASFLPDVLDTFLQELSLKKNVTRSEFVDYLNKYTENSSEDFFEFYSKYGSRKPSIKALNWWLDGDYDSIVRRKVYAEKSLEKLSNMDSKVSQFESELKNIRSLLENAENLLNSHQLNESLKKYKKAIEDIHRIREQDDDGDGLADINEGSYGLDPNNEDSDGDGLADNREVRTIKLDGFAQEWQNLNAKISEETGGIIEKIETARTENYVNIRVEYSKPLYTLKNSQINFGFDFNQDWSDENGHDRYGFDLGGRNFPLEGEIASNRGMENYVYIGDQNLEFKIPVETLEILRFPKKASLRVYVRSDLDGPEFGDGWDTDLGWGQINNVNIRGEYQGKADFGIYNLTIGKKELEPREPVTVSVQVANTGGKKGSYTVELSFDGENITEDVTLNPGQSKEVSFEISEEEAGTYTVSVGGLSEEIKVKSAEEGGLPFIWIGLGIGIVVALVVGVLIGRKYENSFL